MISVSVQSLLESLLGTSAGRNSLAAKLGDFPSVLAGAGVASGHPAAKLATDAPAGPGPSAGELTSAAINGRSSVQGAVDVSLQPATIAQVSTATPDLAPTGLPAAVNALPDQPTDPKSPVLPAASPVVLFANSPPSAAPVERLDVKLQPPLEARASARPTGRRMPAAEADHPGEDQPAECHNPKRDCCRDVSPAGLNIQQALAAAAFLSEQPAHQQQQPTSATAALVQDSPASLANTKNGRSVAHVELLQAAPGGTAKGDQKTAVAVPALTSTGAHSLAMLLQQQPPAKIDILDRAVQSVTSNSPHVAGPSGVSQSTDIHQLDALVRDIAELSGSTGRAAMRITAEQLGPLDIRLHRSDAGMTVSIRTQTEQSHSTVVQAQQQLSDELRTNGVKVAATSVMLGQGGAGTERNDRQPVPVAPAIEAAPTRSEQDQPNDEERPTGRYA